VNQKLAAEIIVDQDVEIEHLKRAAMLLAESLAVSKFGLHPKVGVMSIEHAKAKFLDGYAERYFAEAMVITKGQR